MIESTPHPVTGKSGRYLLILSALIAAACLSCLLLATPPPTRVMVAGSLPAQVCAGFSTKPKWQVGFYWTSPIFSYLPALASSPYLACVELPDVWLPAGLPREVMFPP